jgi:hypothetical protein
MLPNYFPPFSGHEKGAQKVWRNGAQHMKLTHD